MTWSWNFKCDSGDIEVLDDQGEFDKERLNGAAELEFKQVGAVLEALKEEIVDVPVNPPAPIVNREMPVPDEPWKGGNRSYYFHFLVNTDTYSKWPEMAVTKSTKIKKLYPTLELCLPWIPRHHNS